MSVKSSSRSPEAVPPHGVAPAGVLLPTTPTGEAAVTSIKKDPGAVTPPAAPAVVGAVREDENKNKKIPSLLSLWERNSEQYPDGIGVGCVVFAPIISSTKSAARGSHKGALPVPPSVHYQLAEITGVQAAERTVTVASLLSPPGMEELAFPLSKIIPCPYADFFVENSRYCSLLERFLAIAPEDGPPPTLPSHLLRTSSMLLKEHLQTYGYCGGDERQPFDTSSPTSLSTLPSVKKERKEALSGSMKSGSGGGRDANAPFVSLSAQSDSWTFSHVSSLPEQCSYAEAFRVIDQLIEELCACVSAPVMLCLFPHYQLLRRFEVFMASRGHYIQMVDDDAATKGHHPFYFQPGKRSRPSINSTIAATPTEPQPSQSQAKPPREVFGMNSKTWLCMLWDDVELASLSNSVGYASISVLLRFTNEEAVKQHPVADSWNDTLVHSCHNLIATRRVRFIGFPRSKLRVDDRSQSQATTIVKVSGEVFEGRKILVPPSPHQLLLLSTIHSFQLTYGAQEDANLFNSILRERISLGNFTDSSAENLFSSYSNIRAILSPQNSSSSSSLPSFSTMHQLCSHFFEETSKFGESFPLFGVAMDIIRDAFESVRPGSDYPRVAIVLPRGNLTSNQDHETMQFIENVKVCCSPWATYQLQTNPSASQATVTWFDRGGILLLFSDEEYHQMSLLHLEADIVIACGKRAATWVAASSSVLRTAKVQSQFFAIISEIEVVASSFVGHQWVPYAGSSPPSGTTEALWQHLVDHYQKGLDASSLPKTLQQSMSLWVFLSQENRLSKRWSWTRLLDKAKSLALSTATCSPIRITDLQLVL